MFPLFFDFERMSYSRELSLFLFGIKSHRTEIMRREKNSNLFLWDLNSQPKDRE